MSKKMIVRSFLFAIGIMFVSSINSLFEGNLLIGLFKSILLIVLFSVSYKYVFD